MRSGVPTSTKQVVQLYPTKSSGYVQDHAPCTLPTHPLSRRLLDRLTRSHLPVAREGDTQFPWEDPQPRDTSRLIGITLTSVALTLNQSMVALTKIALLCIMTLTKRGSYVRRLWLLTSQCNNPTYTPSPRRPAASPPPSQGQGLQGRVPLLQGWQVPGLAQEEASARHSQQTAE